jgi:general secretion pathway protein G
MNAERDHANAGRRAWCLGTLLSVAVYLLLVAPLAYLVFYPLCGPTSRGRSSKIQRAESHIESHFATALDMFKAAVGRYPTTEEGLRILTTPVGVGTDGRKQPILQKLPRDPWGSEYQYACPGTYNVDAYDLWSYGPDGQPSGGDDLTNWEHKDVPADPDGGPWTWGFLFVLACGVVLLLGILSLGFWRRARKHVTLCEERGGNE